MKTPHDANDLDPAHVAAAAEWLVEAEEGFAPGRAEAFVAWCAQDPRHAAAARSVGGALQLLERMPEFRAPLEQTLRPPARSGASVHWLAWASGLAAVLVLGFVLARPSLREVETAERRIATDGESARLVALEDGSVVNVDGNSELRVNLTARERRVVLTAGEAQFEVAHDSSRPFVVYANDVAVRAVGTAFHVRRGPSGVEVTVMEGRVAVTRASTSVIAQPTLDAGERVRLPHTRAQANEALASVEKIDPALVRTELARQSKRILFSDVPLREAAAQFNLRNRVQLVIADSQLAARKIAGTFPLDQVDAFARLLEQDGDVVLERTDHTIVLHLAR